MTGSTTSGTVLGHEVGDGLDDRALKSIPVLAASAMSSKTASSCARANAGGASCTAVTAVVFWAVRATIALMPWQAREGLQVGLDTRAGIRGRDGEAPGYAAVQRGGRP